jgi:FixJ family two-component response regulator
MRTGRPGRCQGCAPREPLELLIRFAGWQPETFASAQEFLAHPPVSAPSCLVLDVSLPDLNGLHLQKRIVVDRIDMPIVFTTGYGDVPMTVRAMRAVSGLLNKQVGDELGISEITVKAHRGKVMGKMKAESLASLVNKAARLHFARASKG